MKTLYLLFLLFAGAVVATAVPIAPKKVVFERDDGIWIVKPGGNGAKQLVVHAQSPDLSPDGTQIAYNTVQEAGKPAHRQLAIYNLTTGKSVMFTAIPSDNALEPLWSPDGKKLLFNYYANNDRLIGVVNANGTGFQQVPVHKKNYWGETWASDGASFFADDMDSIYLMNLNGKVLKKWGIQELVPNGSMSGDCRMDASLDGAYLLMDVDMDEPARDGWDGPPSSIWELNLRSGKAIRLTPADLYAWDCQWYYPPDSFLCVSQRPKDATQSIFWMSVRNKGEDKKSVIRDGSFPSTQR